MKVCSMYDNYGNLFFFFFFFFIKQFFCRTHSLCNYFGATEYNLLKWISGDVSSGFQSQSGLTALDRIADGECNGNFAPNIKRRKH